MSVAKYYVGQIVYFEHEYMTAVMLPGGHHEQVNYTNLKGIIRESCTCGGEWEYTVDPIDDTGEIDYEIVVDETEILDVECEEQSLSHYIDSLVAL